MPFLEYIFRAEQIFFYHFVSEFWFQIGLFKKIKHVIVL